jgi:NADH-quinone oxidoreductase subunit D
VRFEVLKTDPSTWEIGPYHPALPGPMKLRLQSDGELIISARYEIGYLHRGLEKCLELHPWIASIAYVDHLEPEASAFGEAAYCLAVEEIGKIPVPPRAKVIRIILLELSRVSSHLSAVAKMASSVGTETAVHYVLRDRERILDLFELLSGARFSLNFMRFGGVASDITEGFIERVLEVCEMVRHRLKEYNDLFTFNHAFLDRTRAVGVLDRKTVLDFGITGPNARASGVGFDVRKQHPYLGYEELDFETPLGREDEGMLGDAHGRFMVRLREIAQSIEILKHISEGIPPGDFASIRVERDFRLPRGEAFSRIESPRGLMGCHLVSDGGATPARAQFTTPSSAVVGALPLLLKGARTEDLAPILSSLDISVAEADR